LTKETYLGGLLSGEKAETYDAFYDHILACCARVLAFAGDSDLVFVGRSPESIFDHLSGLLFDTSWFDRLELLQFSMRFRDEAEIRKQYPAAIPAIRDYLERLDLHPSALTKRSRSVTFIDLVLTGETFKMLIRLVYNWSKEIRIEWEAVRRRIHLVGITSRMKTSPKTWRWQQHADWINLLERGSVKNVSIPPDLWRFLGDYQCKVTRSFTPSRWGSSEAAQPSYNDDQLKGLRRAYDLFRSGKSNPCREELVARMITEPAMKHGWFRSLVQQIRP